MNDEYIPKPSSNATAFVVQTPRIRIILMSTSGWSERDSLRTHSASSTRPTAMHPSVFTDSQCQFAVSLTATRTAASPSDISAAPAQFTRPGTRTGDSGTNRWVATVATTTGIERQPEEVMKGEVVDDRSRQNHAGAAADAEQRRHQADRGSDALARELVPDDPESQREDAAGRTLDHASDEHQRERRCERGHERADRQKQKDDHQQPLLAVHVAEPADQRCRHRSAQEVRRQDPADGVLRGVQRVLDVRQRGRDKRLQQRVRDAAQGEDDEGEARMQSVGLGGHAEQGRRHTPTPFPLTLPEETYFTSVSILNIGMYIEMMMTPTMTPTPIIMIGSTIDVSDCTDASTSSS